MKQFDHWAIKRKAWNWVKISWSCEVSGKVANYVGIALMDPIFHPLRNAVSSQINSEASRDDFSPG